MRCTHLGGQSHIPDAYRRVFTETGRLRLHYGSVAMLRGYVLSLRAVGPCADCYVVCVAGQVLVRGVMMVSDLQIENLIMIETYRPVLPDSSLIGWWLNGGPMAVQWQVGVAGDC